MSVIKSSQPLCCPLRRYADARKVSTLLTERKQQPNLCPLMKHNTKLKQFEDIPGPRNLPLIGTLWQYLPGGRFFKTDEAYSLTTLHSEYGTVIRENLFGTSLIRLFDPTDFVTVFSSEQKSPKRPGFEMMTYYNDTYNNGKHGLLTGNGCEWISMRKSVQNQFMQPKEVAKYTILHDSIAQSFVERINQIKDADSTIEDLTPELYKYAIESLAALCFGFRLGALQERRTETETFINSVNSMMNILQEEQKRLPWYKLMNTSSMKLFSESISSIRYLSKVYSRASVILQNSLTASDTPLLRPLLPLDDEEFSVFITDVLFASVDTTGHSLAFMLYQLSKNQHIQEKLFSEVKDFGKNSRSLSADLRSMTYLKSVIKETLRIMPVVPSIGRFLTKDIQCSGYHIPAGTMVALHHGWTGKQTRYFDNPDSFLPERWLEKKCPNYHPYSFLPFGFGARSCVGQRIAMQELSLAVIRILQNYEVNFLDKDLKIEYNLVSKPKDKLKFQFIDRHRKGQL
ncbi:probable cytochrome P450 12e1, mitochondrial [Argonauta hians]